MRIGRLISGLWAIGLLLGVRLVGGAVEVDDAEIRIAAQAGEGAVWAIRARVGPAVFRWSEKGWETRHSWDEWPGNVVDLAADPSHRDSVLSAWFGVAGDGGQDRTLQVWRHTPGGRSRRVTAFPNPTVQDERWRRSLPRLSVDGDGNAWLPFAAPVVLEVAAASGTPRRIDIPLDAFAPIAGEDLVAFEWRLNAGARRIPNCFCASCRRGGTPCRGEA